MSRRKLTPEVQGAIRTDREVHGLTITQIMGKYDLSKGTASKAIQGLDASNVRRAAPRRRVVGPTEPLTRPNLTTTDLGEAVRKMAVGRILLAGLRPFTPVRESTPIDILVLRDDGKVLRCQCKWMWPNKRGNHMLPLTSLRAEGNGKRSRHTYTDEEVDFFIGYCQDNDSFYVVPRAVTEGRQVLFVWVLREPCGTNNRERFDADLYRNAFHLMSQ